MLYSDRMRARILIVEDDQLIADALSRGLSRLGYTVLEARNGAQAVAKLRNDHPSLMLLDLGLPDIDGAEVLRQLRAEQNTLPVIMLTARDDRLDRIGGLLAGADDYVVKPFDLIELHARIQAVLRRVGHPALPGLTVGALQLLPDELRITLDSAPLALTPRELQVLRRLMKSRDRVVTKAQLIDAMQALNESVADKSVEVYVHRIRGKIVGHDVEIVTARGFGYLLRHMAKRC